jgi:hypothetical protein
MNVQFENVGFRRPVRHARPLTPRKVAFAHLIMTVGLVMSIAVAATAVSIGIARAETPAGTTSYEGPIAAVIVVGGLLAVTGVIAAAVTGRSPRD